MTDFEKTLDLFNNMGVDFEVERFSSLQKDTYDGQIEYNHSVTLNSGIGFYGFKCTLYFEDGKYKGHGCWE